MTEELCSRAEELIRSGNRGLSVVRQLTKIVDDLLVSACSELFKPGLQLSLVAVGGYGRREIVPHSDIDIMLLARKRDNPSMEIAQSILYRLWDIGLNISHCFRTLSECVEDAMNDLQTRTSIIESRFLAGNQSLFDEFMRDVYQRLLFKGKREFTIDILREIEKRHREYGDSIYLLEPNIKEGRGGLRDIHSISWLLRTALRMNEIEGLMKILSASDYNHLLKAYDFVLKIRLCLHYISRRRNDILSFELQDEVAKSLGFKDTKRFLAAEILMRLYYRKAKSIMDVLSKVADICSRRYIELPIPVGIKKITDDFYLSKNEIIVKDKGIFKDTDKILEAFRIYSITGKRFSPQLRDAIRSRSLFINKKTRSSRRAIMHFMDILKGNRVYETLREMHDTGILDRFIPEFGRLRHLVIHEPYHRYTVDEHTLIAIKNLEMLKNTCHKRVQYLADILRSVKQEEIILSILLHDIGKGTPEMYHEDYGYRLLKGVMERFNIEHNSRQKIEFLVRNHIVLSRLALTRDIDAMETITQLAEIVENEDNLNALYLMTYADMTAVNPHFWTEWKAYLFHDLYIRTKAYLSGITRQYHDIPDIKIKGFVKNMPDRYLISNTLDAINIDYQMATMPEEERPVVSISERGDGTSEFTIVTNDMPGLFSKIVGVLGFRGLNILRARLYTGKDGLVIDKILIANWRDMWWQGMEEQIKKELRDAIGRRQEAIGKAIYKLSPIAYGLLPISKRFESFIEIDNETSSEYTILELFLHDRLGLLYDISTRLYGHDIDIMSAVINTEDSVARDVFYLQQRGDKLSAESVMNLLNSIQEIIL